MLRAGLAELGPKWKAVGKLSSCSYLGNKTLTPYFQDPHPVSAARIRGRNNEQIAKHWRNVLSPDRCTLGDRG